MKISFFSVNNFRGISGGLEKNKIIFQDTNTLFLYGPNNVGKSTFLKAYEFFYLDSKPTIDDFNKRNKINNIEFEIEVELDEFDKVNIETRAKKQAETYKAYLKDNKLRVKKTWKFDGKAFKVTNETYDFDKNEYVSKGYASIGLHTVFQSCMPTPIFIKAMPTEDEAKSILNNILKAMAENTLGAKELAELTEAKDKIKSLQDKMYKPELIEEYEGSVNKYFSKIFKDTKISFTENKDKLMWTENKLGKDFNIEFKKHFEGNIDDSVPSSSDKIGHGTIRTAIFTLLLMKDVAEEFQRRDGRKDYMVLFEEPELFLYPKIVKELRDLIYQVSVDDLPYQVLCASHSPSMIDLTKPKSSIIRLVSSNDETCVHQINDSFLKEAKEIQTNEELKQEMYEILRFNPYVCESFYADEVLLIEGPTEEILARAYFQELEPKKDIFILNCGTVNNIPFYQKILSKFNIKYHVVFDTDGVEITGDDAYGNPVFKSNIQKSITEQFCKDIESMQGNSGILRVHHTTFEPAHKDERLPEVLRYVDIPNTGKPLNANLYWKNQLQPNLKHKEISKVPFLFYLNEMIEH